MSHVHQREEWLQELAALRLRQDWSELSDQGRRFLAAFENNLLQTDSSRRANVVTPFTLALQNLLAEQGISVDRQPAKVQVADIARSCDVSFICQGVPWLIEIKVGLEFNSLGAAVLEAMAFRRQSPNARIVLLSLYGKWRKGNLLDVLESCAGSVVFDAVHVLTSNALKADEWYSRWVRETNCFVSSLPQLDL